MPHDETAPFPDTQTLRSILAACTRDLTPLLPRLAAVIRDREEDFLQLGAAVFGINGHAGKFSTAAGSMAAFVGEEALRGAIGQLQGHTTEARSIFSATGSEAQMRDMADALELIDVLDRAMQDFAKLVRALQILEITTRIESARLGSSGLGFTTLADDVKSLSGKIAGHAGTIREHTRTLTTQVTEARDRNRHQLDTRARQVEGIFASLFSGIASLETMRGQSAVLVTDLANASTKVATSMGHIIASVQFHDITRQQVEHVHEILEQVLAEIGRDTAGAELPGLAAWIRDVLRLQAPQLRQARDMFCQAVTELIGNLDGIAADIDKLGLRIATVGRGEQEGNGASTLDAIRLLIVQVMEAMRSTGEEVAATGRAMARMATTIAAAGAFVEGIEDIGMEIELIALNASVKAARTGEMGRALGVLAVEIQHLSVRARTQTTQAADMLHRIAEVAQRLADQSSAADIEDGIRIIQGHFEDVLGRLGTLDTELETSIARLSDMGTGLAHELRTLTASIRFHEQVSREMLDLEQHLRDLESAFDPFEAVLEAARQPDKLREQLQRYTMDSERLVHAVVTGEAGAARDEDDGIELFGDDDGVEFFDPAPAPAPEPTAPNGTADDDFGDNVELF